MDLAACRTWCVRSAYMYARLPNVMHMDLHLLGRKRRRLPLACAPLLSVLSYLPSAAGLVPGGGWVAAPHRRVGPRAVWLHVLPVNSAQFSSSTLLLACSDLSRHAPSMHPIRSAAASAN
jgi:hypothetical protein